jgi:hypothetical protein
MGMTEHRMAAGNGNDRTPNDSLPLTALIGSRDFDEVSRF